MLHICLLHCVCEMKYNSIDTSPVSKYVMHPFWNWLVEVCVAHGYTAMSRVVRNNN